MAYSTAEHNQLLDQWQPCLKNMAKDGLELGRCMDYFHALVKDIMDYEVIHADSSAPREQFNEVVEKYSGK